MNETDLRQNDDLDAFMASDQEPVPVYQAGDIRANDLLDELMA